MKDGHRKNVGILALPGAVLYGIASPLHVFGRLGDMHFNPFVLGVTTDLITTDNGLIIQPTYDLEAVADIDVLVIPGTTTAPTAKAPRCVVDAIRYAVEKGTTVASVCTGVFIAAQTGLLDSHLATAHWAVADQLQQRFPRLRVDPQRLFVSDAPILSCAGSSASYEMFLSIYRDLAGTAASRTVARTLVHPLARDETSPQVIDYPFLHSDGNSMLQAQEWRLARIHYRVSVEDWATQFAMSAQRFTNSFKAYTGTTPHQWLTEQRMLLAAGSLVETGASVEEVSRMVGIPSVSAFRRQFISRWGVSPTVYRRQQHKVKIDGAAVSQSLT